MMIGLVLAVVLVVLVVDDLFQTGLVRKWGNAAVAAADD